MATLNLTKIFVNLLSTGAAVSGQSAPGRGEVYEAAGEVRIYAGGRRRSIASVGEQGTFTFKLLMLTRADVDLLHTWQQQAVQVRDHKGRLFVGVYYGLTISEYRDRARWDVAITLHVVDVPTAV